MLSLDTVLTGNGAPIDDNWSRSSHTGFGLLGTGMSQSSGIFTFPSTGFWHILFGISQAHTAASRYNGGEMYVTLDNSSYNFVGQCYQSLYDDGSGTSSSGMLNYVLDVTNTTNVKVRFVSTSQDNNHIANADTSVNYNYATFIKLADT